MPERYGAHAELARAASTGVRVMGLRLSGYAVGLIASILIARALGPAGRGLYAYPVALLGTVLALAHIGLEFAHLHLAGQGADVRRMWANATLYSVVAGALCWAVVGTLLAADPGLADGLPLSWIVLVMGLLPLLLMNLYWTGLFQLDGRLVSAARAAWYGVALQAAAVCVLYPLHELTPFRVLVLQWLINGTTWLLLAYRCHRSGLVSLRPDLVMLRRSAAFGLKVYAAVLSFYLLLRLDQVMVREFAGYRQLGLYTLAVTVAQLIWLLTDPLTAALVPHQLRAQDGDDRWLGYAMLRLSLWMSVPVAVAAWLLAPLAFRAVYGPGFVSAVPAMRLLLPGVVILGAARPLGAVLVKEGRAIVLSALSSGAVALNVALNLLLLPRIGIRGASIASTVCYSALALSYVAATRRPGVAGWRDTIPRRSDLRLLSRYRMDPDRTGPGLMWRARPDRRRAGLPENALDGPLRLAFVVGSLDRGGTERQILLLGSELAALGHHVTVVCLTREGHNAAAARAAGIRVVVAGFPGLRRGAPNPVGQFRRLRAIIRDDSPQVVHCFLYWGYLIGVPVARSAGVPVVVSSRRSLTAVPGRYRCLGPWERACDRIADAVVCNSEAVMADAIAHTGLPRRKGVVIHNGVLAADAAPAAGSGPGEHCPRIVILANLIPYKGHRVALTAFALLRAASPGVVARLQLAGSGPEEAALRAQARELGIEADVEFLGSVAEVSSLLAACSFTVLPTLSEGMPNAVLESLAHGRPVVASAAGGVPEILSRGGGILIPPGDPEALAEAMSTLLASPALVARLGAQGRELVREQFGVGAMVTQSVKLYRGLLAGLPPRAVMAGPADLSGPGQPAEDPRGGSLPALQ